MTDRTVAHYQFQEKLGEGGMGVVYRARDTHLDRDVAIKVLAADALSDPERKRRFVQEAKAASALNHPNIVTIHDISSADGVDFIVMEYVAGKPLDRVIPRRGLPLAEALPYAIEIADALAAAHAAGIIHRDLKPGNIMISDKGHAKVLDFGLAKLAEAPAHDEAAATLDQPPRTEAGSILGTTAYMSPEQAEGLPVDGRSDIFSFGTVLYEMITGQRPFRGETRISTITAILREEPKALSEIIEGLPHELERIVTYCLRKDRRRRSQHMDDIKIALEGLKEESDSGKLLAPPAIMQRRRPWVILAAVVLIAVAIGAAWWLRRSRPLRSTSGPRLTRLTSDSGLNFQPAISPDGRLVAYASDRAGKGGLDIWVQQLAGGDAIRLTQHPADDYEPSFSPDGSRVAFRSEREGGGLYVVSALGGGERIIAKQGRNPRFSPDGKWIAYWVGEPHFAATGTRTKLYRTPAAGGSPIALASELFAAGHPVWTPDGGNILFIGREPNEPPEWWVIPAESGPAVRTGALDSARKAGLFPVANMLPIRPDDWLGESVLFAARQGDTTSLWRIPISPKSWQAGGAPERLTLGTGREGQPSVASGSGRVVFASLTENADLWRLPLQPNEGKVTGEIERLTSDGAMDFYPSASADGNRVAFISTRSGNQDVWLKDIASGRENALTETPGAEGYPKITRAGSKVAYTIIENRKSIICVVPSGGGVAERVCEDCGRVWDWAEEDKRILHMGVQSLDVSSGQSSELLRHPQYAVLETHPSPDGRWLVFHNTIDPLRRQIYVAPYSGVKIEPSRWIPITDGKGLDRNGAFSPDGNMIYFLSERDGSRCIWAQRLDPRTKQPQGDAFAVYHAHNARRSLTNFGDPGASSPTIGGKYLIFSLDEVTGNIWMMEQQPSS